MFQFIQLSSGVTCPILSFFFSFILFSPYLFQEVEFSVFDVQVHGGFVLHVGALEGSLKVGDKMKCLIDEVRFPATFSHSSVRTWIFHVDIAAVIPRRRNFP